MQAIVKMMIAIGILLMQVLSTAEMVEAGLTGIPDIDIYSKEIECACGLTKQAPVGCSISKACSEGKTHRGYCAPQSIWNDVCGDDLAQLRKDGICERYQDTCIESTSKDCSTGFPDLPKTSQIRSLVKEMCTEMPKMKACKGCNTGDCDEPFTAAYIPLCVSMPGMHECIAWKSMCAKAPEPEIRQAWRCPEKDEEDPPPMRMFLHFSRIDYILFSWWVPRSYLAYFLTCVFCFLFGVISSSLRILRVRAEAQWSAIDSDTQHGEYRWFAPPSFATNAKRATFLALVSVVDFMLMLLVMSFNVGIIAACVLGLAFGHFLFGHMTPQKTVPSCCCAGE
jgi:hypothetical protein